MSGPRREAGVATIFDPGADRPLVEIATLFCVHCGGHWIPQPGSGRVRGFCQNCNGLVCGPGCADCVPVEQYLSNLESGRDPTFKPVVVPVCVPVSFSEQKPPSPDSES